MNARLPDSVVLAVDLGGTKMAFALADDTGRILASRTESTQAELGADQALRRALGEASRLAHRAAELGSRVRAIGLSTMGITTTDGVRLAPTVDGWHDLRIPGRVREALPGIPAVIGNDVRAATLAELRWGVLQEVADAVYLNLGTGVAAGLVTQGQVLAGARGAAGEIGYLLRGPGDLARKPGGAPLEEAVSGKAIASRTAAALGRPLSFAELHDAAAVNPAADGLLREVVADIAVAVANLAVTLNPEMIVVGGGFARSPDGLLARLRLAVEHAPFPPQVRLSRFGADAGLHGAIALALDAPTDGWRTPSSAPRAATPEVSTPQEAQ